MGTWTSGRLTWLNEVTVKGGYNLTNNIRATIGYNFLYLDDVVRAEQCHRHGRSARRPGVECIRPESECDASRPADAARMARGGCRG